VAVPARSRAIGRTAKRNHRTSDTRFVERHHSGVGKQLRAAATGRRRGRLWVAGVGGGYGLPASGGGYGQRPRAATGRGRLRAAGVGGRLWAASVGGPATGCGRRGAGYGLRASGGYGLRASGAATGRVYRCRPRAAGRGYRALAVGHPEIGRNGQGRHRLAVCSTVWFHVKHDGRGHRGSERGVPPGLGAVRHG
jgi:hypothetical protein